MENRGRSIKKDLAHELSALVSHLKINESLKEHTTFRIGGPARYFVEIETRDELIRVFNYARQNSVPFIVLGSGSNILAGDNGFDGIVARLSGDFQFVKVSGSTIRAGSGVKLGALIQKSVNRNLSGLECMAAVPGTLGGAIVGNAGTSEGTIADIVLNVEVVSETGNIVTLNKNEIQFFYRGSSLKGKIILGAALSLKKGKKNDILGRIKNLVSRRAETQPLDEWSAGSVFKNPEGFSAGKLIDESGLKGLVFGGAKVSEKHGNFIINTGAAKASDVKTLIKMVHNKVKQKTGINLELEIQLVE